MSLLILLAGAGEQAAVVVAPYDTCLAINLPALQLRAISTPIVPFLLDEAGNQLLSEDSEPLIDESQIARLEIRLPPLEVKKVR